MIPKIPTNILNRNNWNYCYSVSDEVDKNCKYDPAEEKGLGSSKVSDESIEA